MAQNLKLTDSNAVVAKFDFGNSLIYKQAPSRISQIWNEREFVYSVIVFSEQQNVHEVKFCYPVWGGYYIS